MNISPAVTQFCTISVTRGIFTASIGAGPSLLL